MCVFECVLAITVCCHVLTWLTISAITRTQTSVFEGASRVRLCLQIYLLLSHVVDVEQKRIPLALPLPYGFQVPAEVSKFNGKWKIYTIEIIETMGHSCENAMPIKIEEDASGKVCCWCHTGTHQYKNRYTHKHSHCIANARKTKATISVVFAEYAKNKYSKVGYIKKNKCCTMVVIEHSHWTNI